MILKRRTREPELEFEVPDLRSIDGRREHVERSLGDADLEVIPDLQWEGRPVEAHVPKVPRRFHSDLHTRTTPISESWRTELPLVLNKQVPATYLCAPEDDPQDSQALQAELIDAFKAGFVGGLAQNPDGLTHGYIAIPDQVQETIDLDALQADYRAWFTAVGLIGHDLPGPSMARVIDSAMAQLSDETYGEHAWRRPPWRPNTPDWDDTIIEGIVYGADPAATCAVLLSELTHDDRWWPCGIPISQSGLPMPPPSQRQDEQ